MTFDWNLIVGPLVGAVIGLITNGIAIRMLFRPLHAVKIGNFTLPFTPGLIPKEKSRIAHSIGNLVANNLLNVDVLKRGMINKEIDDKLVTFIDTFLAKYKDSKETIRTLLYKNLNEQRVNSYTVLIENKLSEIAYQKALDLNIGNLVIDAVYKEFDRREQEDPMSIQFMPAILSLVQDRLVDLINSIVDKQGFFIISDFVTKQGDEILDMPLSQIYAQYEQYIPRLNELVLNFYHYAVINYLPTILIHINIAKLVEDRINEFSLEELEKLLLDLMRKELNAIVYLGGLLGAIMGLIMDFF